MLRILKSLTAVVAAIIVLTVPATSFARSTSGATGAGGAARTARLTFYQEAVRDQRVAETRFYAIPASSPGDGLGGLTYVLGGCVVLLVGAGTAAAWRFERRPSRSQSLILTAS